VLVIDAGGKAADALVDILRQKVVEDDRLVRLGTFFGRPVAA
jgi:hypothetical protein